MKEQHIQDIQDLQQSQLLQEVKNVYHAEITSGVFKDYALLGASGAEVGKKSTVADAEGSYYYVNENGKIYKADSSLLNASKTVSAFKSGKKVVTIDSHDYTIVETDKDGYTDLTLKY